MGGVTKYGDISSKGFEKNDAVNNLTYFTISSPYTLTQDYQETDGSLVGQEIQFQWTRLDSGDASASPLITLNLKEGEINDLGTIIINP